MIQGDINKIIRKRMLKKTKEASPKNDKCLMRQLRQELIRLDAAMVQKDKDSGKS